MKETFTIQELSDYLRCSTSKLRELVKKNEIPFFRIGAKLFFKRTSIETWIAEQEQSASIEKNYESEVI